MAGSQDEYTPEVGVLICDRVAAGESLTTITKDPGMPCRKTVYTWRMKHPEFNALYELAIRVLADMMADEIISIADGAGTEMGFVNRDRLRVDSRKWYLGKVLPKVYGERVHQEITGKDGAPLVNAVNIRLVKPGD